MKGAMGSFRVPSTRRSDRFWPRRGAKTAFLCEKGQDTHCVSCPLAQRKGFEPLNAFNTLHDFQSCAFDQLSHLCTVSLLNSKNYCSRTLKKSQEKNPNYSRNFPTKRSRPVCCALRGRLFQKNSGFGQDGYSPAAQTVLQWGPNPWNCRRRLGRALNFRARRFLKELKKWGSPYDL